MPPAPVRVAFVGREVQHRHWTLTEPAGDLDPHFVDHREGASTSALLDRLAELAPDVVVAFQPQLVPAAELDAITLALVTDELPVLWELDVWHPIRDLQSAATGLRSLDLSGYDRIAVTDPRLAAAAPHLTVWRSPPLPVDDVLFLDDDRAAPRPLHPLFLGESTPYREAWLTDAKHHYELSHYAFGLTGWRLREVLESANVGVVLREAEGLTGFDPAVALHLAAGHLLIAEPLVPTRGLEPGLDHLTVEWPDQLMHALYQVNKRPHAFEQVRRRGRIRADELRASRIWPRLVHDLLADVAAFGPARRRQPASA